ncbi:protein of unknown function [Bradyrhizobium vignae]|uniref:Uncharacterized protein n=1 Tax=Bradyrhizobium vignae TaxID=1549949 RepID=A0A2U3PZQ4_9BRAD|nr:protein of unknown function [Bradyrhizobium vignae]
MLYVGSVTRVRRRVSIVCKQMTRQMVYARQASRRKTGKRKAGGAGLCRVLDRRWAAH